METKTLYNVLIVDDEEDVIRIIIDTMNWEEMGFHMWGYAHNGVEALEMCEESMPDVVLTDIKMPYMDGLTLGHRLKEMDPGIRLVIFSGFDEFEYAKEAIKLEVEEYLLKPIDMAELKAVFARVKSGLDKEKETQSNLGQLQEYYLESLPILQEGFFAALLEGRLDERQIQQSMNGYQIRMTGPRYLAAVVHISGWEEDGDVQQMLRTMQVRQMLDSFPSDYRLRHILYLRDIVLLAELDEAQDTADFTDVMNTLAKTAGRLCGAPVTIGIGTECTAVKDLPVSYKNARQAVSYRAIYGTNRAINMTEIDAPQPVDTSAGSVLVHDIIRLIRLGDRDKLRQTVQYSVAAVSVGSEDRGRLTTFLMELLSELTALGNSSGLGMDDIFPNPSETVSLLFETGSTETLTDHLTRTTLKIQEQMSRRRETTANSFVDNAITYVQENYANQDITIETVCRELGVSAAYFSTLFKKETGKTFINYLTDYRMDKAVHLLETTADRTYMIADKIGYSDSNYFSYVFKKKYGLSPSKYRQKIREGAENL